MGSTFEFHWNNRTAAGATKLCSAHPPIVVFFPLGGTVSSRAGKTTQTRDLATFFIWTLVQGLWGWPITPHCTGCSVTYLSDQFRPYVATIQRKWWRINARLGPACAPAHYSYPFSLLTSEARIQLMPSKWSDQYTRCLFFVHFVVVFQVSVIAIHAFWLMYPSTTCYLTHDVDLTWFDCVCLIWSFIFELFMNNQQGVSAKHQCCSCTHLSQTAHFKHSHVWTYLNN